MKFGPIGIEKVVLQSSPNLPYFGRADAPHQGDANHSRGLKNQSGGAAHDRYSIARSSRDRPGDFELKDKRKGAPIHSTQVESNADFGGGRAYLDLTFATGTRSGARRRAAAPNKRLRTERRALSSARIVKLPLTEKRSRSFASRRRAEVRVKKGRRAVPPAQVPMSERNAGEDTGLGMNHRRAGQERAPWKIKPVVET
jgi:hypothetical protein